MDARMRQLEREAVELGSPDARRALLRYGMQVGALDQSIRFLEPSDLLTPEELQYGYADPVYYYDFYGAMEHSIMIQHLVDQSVNRDHWVDETLDVVLRYGAMWRLPELVGADGVVRDTEAGTFCLSDKTKMILCKRYLRE